MPRKRRTDYDESKLEVSAAFFTGGVLERLSAYARSLGLSETELAARVGASILSTAHGQVLGPAHRVPDVRAKTAKGSKAVEPVAVAKRAYSKQPSKVKRKKQKRSYWEGLTPRQRKNEMKRRQAKWSEDALNRWHKRTNASAVA
jgi:hypothetical protein